MSFTVASGDRVSAAQYVAAQRRDLQRLLRKGTTAAVPGILRDYTMYSGLLGHRAREAFLERLQAALGGQHPRLALRAVLDECGALVPTFVEAHAPELMGAFLRADNSEVEVSKILVEASENAYFSRDLPLPLGKALARQSRPPYCLLSQERGQVFVSPHVHQTFHADRGTYTPRLSSRAVAAPALALEATNVSRPIVLIRDTFAGGNFAHLLFDMLPRILHLAEQCPVLASEALFVMGDDPSPLCDRLLGLVSRTYGIPQDRFFFPNAPAVLSTSRRIYGFSDQQEITHPAHLCEPTTLGLVRGLISRMPVGNSSIRRVYISRSDAKSRRVENEAEVRLLVEGLGFTAASLGGMEIDQQIALVARAEAVVGPHGMGLTHLIFNQGRPAVLELFNPSAGTSAYAMVCRALGFHYNFILGTETDPTTRDFAVEPVVVEHQIRSIIGIGSTGGGDARGCLAASPGTTSPSAQVRPGGSS